MSEFDVLSRNTLLVKRRSGVFVWILCCPVKQQGTSFILTSVLAPWTSHKLPWIASNPSGCSLWNGLFLFYWSPTVTADFPVCSPRHRSTDITNSFVSLTSLAQTTVWKSFGWGHNRDECALKCGALTTFPLSVVLLGCWSGYCGFNPNAPVQVKERAHYYSLCELHCSC